MAEYENPEKTVGEVTAEEAEALKAEAEALKEEAEALKEEAEALKAEAKAEIAEAEEPKPLTLHELNVLARKGRLARKFAELKD